MHKGRAKLKAESLLKDEAYEGGFPPAPDVKVLTQSDLTRMYPEWEPLLRYLGKPVDLTKAQQKAFKDRNGGLPGKTDPASDPASGAVSLSTVVSVATGVMVFFF